MDADALDSFYDVEALKRATVPDVDSRHGAELTRRDDAAVLVRDRAADDLLVVLDVVPLLAD